MDALLDKWSDPNALKHSIEAVDNIVEQVKSSRNIHAVKTVDEMYVEIEGFSDDDYNKKTAYLYAFKEENHQNDPEIYDALKNKIISWGVDQKVGSRKELREVFEGKKGKGGLEQKYSYPHEEDEKPIIVNGFSNVDQVFGEKPVDYCGYTCNDNGIIGTSPDGRPVRVCLHPIVVSRRYVNNDDPDRPRETIDISFYQDGRWKTIPQIPRANIMSVTQIIKLADYGVSVPPATASNLATYLDAFDQANRKTGTIPSVNATGKIGWYDCFKQFVPYTDQVFYDGSIPGTRSMYQAIRSNGSFDSWLNTVKPILDPKDPRNIPNKIMVEGGGFGSVLVRLLGKNCFWINLNSDASGSGKSVVLMAAGSIWGNPFIGDDGYVLAMSGTVNGLEEKAHFCNNLPLCLDEIQTMQDCADWKPLLYRLCQGKGKNRAARGGGSQNDRYWRLIILSTGEMNIVHDDAHEGEINRIVDLFVSGDLMDNPELVADSLQANYGHAGRMFIEALMNEKTENIRKRFYELRSAFMANNRTKKQADAGAMIVLGSELGNKYVLHGTPLTIEQVQTYLATKEQVDINRRAYDQLQDFVTENIECFVAKGNQNPKRVFGKIMDDGKVRILPGIFKSEFLQRHQYSYQGFTQWCVRKGIITKNGESVRLGIDTRLWDGDLGQVAKRPCLEFNLNTDVDMASPAVSDTTTVTPEPEQQAMNIDEQSGFEEVIPSDLPF